MNFFFNVLINIFSLSVFSLFLSFFYKIKLNFSFLISLCFTALYFFFSYIFFPIIYLKYFVYLYFFIILVMTCKIIINFRENISHDTIKLITEFVLISILISIFTWNRYFLDEDELNHWGKIIKYFHFITSDNPLFSDLDIYLYHNPFLPLLHFFNSFYLGFREDISIFSNNLLLLSSFYFVFYKKKEFYLRVFKFSIFYLSLNSLSFGFVSVYADPVIAVLYLCLIFYIYHIKNSYDFKNIVILLILGISLFLCHRSGAVYFLFSFFFLFFINYYQLNKLYILKFIILNFIFFIYIFFYRIHNYNLFDLNSFSYFFKNFLFTDIYFSDFGVSLNLILVNFGFENLKLPEINISVLFWILFILSLFLCVAKKNINILLFIIFQFFLYSLIIYMFKIKSSDLSILVYGRYIGIYLLSIFLFVIYLISIKRNNLILYNFIFLILIFITPKKTYGFFLPNSFYLTQKQNYNFFNQKNEIKKIYPNLRWGVDYLVVQGSLKSLNNADHPSLILSQINFELYPHQIKNREFQTVNFNFYINNFLDFSKLNIIFLNLTNKEKSIILKSNLDNISFLNFD